MTKSSSDEMYITDIVTVQEEIDGIVHLNFGRIEGTNDIYVERFMYKMCQDEKYSNMGCLEKVVEKYVILTDGWYNLEYEYKDKDMTLKEKYMDLIRKNCDGFYRIRKQLFPVVKDFVNPLNKDDIHFYDDIEQSYWEEYNARRGISKWDLYD